tara:strand:- start:200 stop:313 length:114 start_codon:yes stop_codon:yes gene_type:complete
MPKPIEPYIEKVSWELPIKLENSFQGIVSINIIYVAP